MVYSSMIRSLSNLFLPIWVNAFKLLRETHQGESYNPSLKIPKGQKLICPVVWRPVVIFIIPGSNSCENQPPEQISHDYSF